MPPSSPGSPTTCDRAAAQGAGRSGRGGRLASLAAGLWGTGGSLHWSLTTCPEGLPVMGLLAGPRGKQPHGPGPPPTWLSGVSCGSPLAVADRTPGMQGRGSARLTGTMVHVPQGGPPLGCHAAPRPTQGGEDEGRASPGWEALQAPVRPDTLSPALVTNGSRAGLCSPRRSVFLSLTYAFSF